MELSKSELEHIVKGLKEFPVEEVGSQQWLQQILKIEKINLLAHQQAAANQFESVVDAIQTFDKFTTLVHELVFTDLWIQKSLPLIKSKMCQMAFARLYMTTRSVSTMLNLLELAVFHPDNLPEEGLIPLIDFCNKKMAYLCEHDIDEYNETTQEQFIMGFSALSIVWCICSCPEIPLSVVRRIVDEDDVSITVANIIMRQPWRTVKKGKVMKWDNNQIKELPKNESMRVCRPEAHAWTILYQLMGKRFLEATRWTPYKKDTLVKVETLLSEVIIDQIPPLNTLRQSLQYLKVTEIPQPKFSAVIEQVPEMVTDYERDRDWPLIAEKALSTYFNAPAPVLQKEMVELAEFFNIFQ